MISKVILCVFVAVCAGVAGRSITIENEEFGLVSAAKKPPGILWCTGDSLEYRVNDVDLFGFVFNTAPEAQGARVNKVQIGRSNRPGCLATRFPKFGTKLASTIALNYTNSPCDMTSTETDTVIRYSAVVTGVVHLRSPVPGIIFPKPFTFGINCEGSSTGLVHTQTQYFDYVTYLGQITEQFDLLISAKAHQELRPAFGNRLETNVHVITVEVDSPDSDLYEIIGSRCWATPEVNHESKHQYPFITSRGCDQPFAGVPGIVSSDYIQVASEAKRKYVYNVAEFAFWDVETDTFLETDTYYFHCEVNVCRKNGPNGGRCTKSCPNSFFRNILGNNAAADEAPEFRMSSAAIRRNPNNPPPSVIILNGKPISV